MPSDLSAAPQAALNRKRMRQEHLRKLTGPGIMFLVLPLAILFWVWVLA